MSGPDRPDPGCGRLRRRFSRGRSGFRSAPVCRSRSGKLRAHIRAPAARGVQPGGLHGRTERTSSGNDARGDVGRHSGRIRRQPAAGPGRDRSFCERSVACCPALVHRCGAHHPGRPFRRGHRCADRRARAPRQRLPAGSDRGQCRGCAGVGPCPVQLPAGALGALVARRQGHSFSRLRRVGGIRLGAMSGMCAAGAAGCRLRPLHRLSR